MTVSGIFLILLPILIKTSAGTQAVLQALGTSLLASAVFSGVHIFFTNQEFIELMTERMDNLHKAGTQQIVSYLAQTNPTYLPLAVYDPTDGEGTAFNRDLTTSLGSSHTYRFQGMTGYFVPIRLEATKATLAQLRICLADASDQAALRLRVTREIARGASRDYASVIGQLKEQMRQCVVGLLEVRGRCQAIEIMWSTAPIGERYEIFDNDMYVTIFDSGPPIGAKYPRSLKFGRSSFMYDTTLRRFDLGFSATSPKLVAIRPEDSDELVLERLQKAGLDIDPKLYKTYAEQFWKDVESYKNQWGN